MIFGAHVIVFSKDADADRAFFRDVLGFANVDGGGGWLIFRLPPTEAAIHPDEVGGRSDMYLMCDDIAAEIASLTEKGATCSEVEEARFGSVTRIQLPGGGEIGMYQPKHASALANASA